MQNNVLAPIYGPDSGTEHLGRHTRSLIYARRLRLHYASECTTKIVQPNTLPFSCCSSNLQFYPHLENCHKIVSLKSYKEKVRIKEAGRHYACVKCNLKTFFKIQVHLTNCVRIQFSVGEVDNANSPKLPQQTKFRRIGVPTRDSFSRQILKASNPGRVEARYLKSKIVFSRSTNTSPV